MQTIALVDDDRHILTSVSMMLEAEGYRTQTYIDGASALRTMQKSPPDAAILDIKMPRMDGMELLQRLRRKSELPVIFLTSKDQEIDELFGLKMGADDFIRKPFSQRLLLERLRVVLRRARLGRVFAVNDDKAEVIECGELLLDRDRYVCTWKSRLLTLSVTEFLILRALAQRPGIVKSRQAISDVAYDHQACANDRRIDCHIKRLRNKFKEMDDSFDAIETLHGIGYRFKET